MTPEIEQLIATHLTSVEQVEVLLLLRRSPETFWSVEALAGQLFIAEPAADRAARELVRAGWAQEGNSGRVFRFSADEEARRKIDALAAEYRDRRLEVINAVFSANLTRIRSFADAFRLGSGGKKEES